MFKTAGSRPCLKIILSANRSSKSNCFFFQVKIKAQQKLLSSKRFINMNFHQDGLFIAKACQSFMCLFRCNCALKTCSTPNTFKISEVPPAYHDDYIKTGYRRPGMSFLECFRSLFQWNNETLNVWTHCFTLFFFIWKFSTLEVDLLFDRRYWPLLAIAVGACMYPTLSCLAHTFSSMTIPIRNICFFCDYAGISVYSIGSSVAYFAYSIPSHVRRSYLGMLYRPMSVTMAIFCCYVCCVSRDKKWQSFQSTMRALSFAVPYIFTSSFVVHGILISFYTHSLWFHYSQFFWCILMAITMTTKIPEKYFTEVFDVVGHSHQWFHIFVFIATNHQINAVLLDMSTELVRTNESSEWSFGGSVGLVLIVILANALIVGFFSCRVMTLNSEPMSVEKDKSL